MNIQIIIIGDEILSGQTLNTNAAYIGQKLENINLKVTKTSVVSDDESEIIDEFEECYKNNDVIIVTGGLGPTHDDRTLKCITKFFNTELVLNEDILSDIKIRFERRGKELTETNKEQAYIPKIAEPIRNSKGTAPGIWIEKDKKIFTAMPGVPYEMKEMVENFIIPTLKEQFQTDPSIVTTNLLTTGIPESFLYDKLGNLDELLKGAKLAFLPNQYGVKMRLTVKGDSEEDANNRLTEIEQQVRALVGRYIYSRDDDTLEEVVGRLLKDRGLTIAVAESCTGGLISNRITNVKGSSNYFERAFITYSNGAKVEHLKVNEDLIQKYGAVSIEVARLMADGVKAVSGTDIGLAVTGIMGPTSSDTDKPVGLVYVGICDEKICTAKEFRFGEDRILNKDRTSQAALEMLRRNLLGIPYDE